MGPSLVAVQRAGELFADPNVRAQLREWHHQDMPLMEMVDRLGIADLFDESLRAAVAGLTPVEVQVIRDVVLAEIDSAGASTESSLPVDCSLTSVVGPVSVTLASDTKGRPIAHVEAAHE
jgi:hypothetical protein